MDLFACYDNHEDDTYKGCKDAVLNRYGEFGKFWNAAKFVATHFNASSHVQDKCAKVCGEDSVCRTSCQVELYECFDANTPKSEDKIEACEKQVEEKHKGLVSFWAAHVSLLGRSHDMCSDACSDSACVTECEVQMYNCKDLNTGGGNDDEAAIHTCSEGVISEIEGSFTSSFWNVPELLAHRNGGNYTARVVSAKARKEVQSECDEVCGERSMCTTECEVDMYECFDTNTPKSTDQIDTCTDKALEKYKEEKAALPTLLANVDSMATPKAAVFLSKI
jgi:hypothetical protein